MGMQTEPVSQKDLLETKSRFERCSCGWISCFDDGGEPLRDEELRCYEDSNTLFPSGPYRVIGEDDCVECGKFTPRYMEFPLEVSDVVIHPLYRENIGISCHPGRLVAVRPCDPSLEDKTYLGVYVGDLPVGIGMSRNRESGILELRPSLSNPCILVPELGRLVWGCESWWRRIESVEDLKDITDEEIENTWYVKALKTLVDTCASADEPA